MNFKKTLLAVAAVATLAVPAVAADRGGFSRNEWTDHTPFVMNGEEFESQEDFLNSGRRAGLIEQFVRRTKHPGHPLINKTGCCGDRFYI